MSTKKPIAFIAMSFSRDYYSFYNIIEAIAALEGYSPLRIDESNKPIQDLHNEIIQSIKNASIFIGEISSPSKNVFYEVGWAHALNLPTMLVVKKDIEIPFDIKNNQVVTYDPEIDPQALKKLLRAEFSRHFNDLHKNINLKQTFIKSIGSIEKIRSTNDLFTKLIKTTIEDFENESKKWVNDTLQVNSSEAVKKGIKVFHLIKQGGFATYLVPINEFWTSNDVYSEECREAARKGKIIKRVFIIQDYESLLNPSLQEHISLDENAGIQTYISFMKDISDQDSIKDFGIWDDELVCLMNIKFNKGDNHIINGCTFSRDLKVIENAQLWKKNIMLKSIKAKKLLEAFNTLPPSQKYLLQSLSLMNEYSHAYCHGSYFKGNTKNCEWYHSSWQYLRYLKLVSTPDWHNDFYNDMFSKEFDNNPREILICGLADYAILDYIINNIPSKNFGNYKITILDTCQTPIQICMWYIKLIENERRIHINYSCANENALKTRFQNQTFDIITTDAFITRFSFEEKKEIINEWKRLLKPRGKVITTARCSFSDNTNKISPNINEIDNFISRADSQAIQDNFLRTQHEVVKNKAQQYAKNIYSYPLNSEKELESLFKDFNLSYEIGNTPGEFQGGTTYFRIFAIKN